MKNKKNKKNKKKVKFKISFKAISIFTIMVVVGILLANFTSILYFAIIGLLGLISVVAAKAYFETLKEKRD